MKNSKCHQLISNHLNVIRVNISELESEKWAIRGKHYPKAFDNVEKHVFVQTSFANIHAEKYKFVRCALCIFPIPLPLPFARVHANLSACVCV